MTPQGFEPWTLRSGVSRNTTMLWSHVTCVHPVERHTLWDVKANMVIPMHDCLLVQNDYGCVTIMYARDTGSRLVRVCFVRFTRRHERW